MRVLKNIFSQLHIYVLWLLLSAILWGWIFTFVTDTRPEKKVTVFADVVSCRDKELSAELEKELPEGIQMIRVHPFDYAMFDDTGLLNADIYIVPQSRAEAYLDAFSPLPDMEGELWRYEGTAYGLKVYDAATGRGAAAGYLDYGLVPEPEDYYLFFGANSLHTGERDLAALAVAERLQTIK